MFENEDLFEDYYADMDQTNNGCFYYPEFTELPEEIQLPGPCDDRISGMPDFDAANVSIFNITLSIIPMSRYWTSQLFLDDIVYFF